MKRFSLFSLAGGFGYSPAYGGVVSLLLSGLIFLPLAFSQTNETLTISTYYPSPYGVYKELRLYPKAASLASSCSALYEKLRDTILIILIGIRGNYGQWRGHKGLVRV